MRSRCSRATSPSTVIGPEIAEALVSTALGLAVAIIAAMAFNYFTLASSRYVST